MAAIGVVFVGAFTAIMSRPPKQITKSTSVTPPPITAIQRELNSPVEEDPEVPLELASDVQTLPDNTLDQQASSSLETLIGGIAGGKSPMKIEPISFESVAEALNTTNDEAIVQASLAESTSENSFDLSQATKPFPETLDAVPEPSEDSMEKATTSEGNAVDKLSTENPSESGFVAQTFPIKQPQSKSTIRVPFKPIDKQAVCRVKLKMGDNVLLKPEDSVELVGRQDTAWTIALTDDSFNLKVYLRSIPAKSWYVATAVRLSVGLNTEFPIGKDDATRVCIRLQNHLNWLDQNRLIGESMRSNRKTRSMAIAGLEQIETQTKSTEKSLKNWLAIEKLVLAFYQDNAIELELASSSDKLPVE